MPNAPRDDLAFVIRVLNQALDRVQGGSSPAAIVKRTNWRAAMFVSVKECLDQAKAFQKADRDV